MTDEEQKIARPVITAEVLQWSFYKLFVIELFSCSSDLSHFVEKYKPSVKEVIHVPRLPAEENDLFLSFFYGRFPGSKSLFSRDVPSPISEIQNQVD